MYSVLKQPFAITPRAIPFFVFLITAITIFGLSSVRAQTAAEKSATAQVTALLSSVNGSGGSLGRISSAVNRHFAVGTWANALLGNQASAFSSGQKGEFRKLLPQYLAKLYQNQFGSRSVGTPEVSRVRTVRNDVIVTTRLSRGSGGKISVDWRMRSIGGKYRVIDYSVGGISNVVLKRSEFTSKVKQSGAQGLNDFLKSFIRA